MEWKKMAGLIVTGALAASLNAFDLGKQDTTIYTTAKNGPAANELSGYLKKVFGKKYPVKGIPAKITPEMKGIFVGVKPESYTAKWNEKRDCSVRIVENDRVWLFGNDGKGMSGTANAVYDFLEKYAGVRWLWPGETGTVADPKEPVSIAPETFVYVPPFERRMTSSFTYGFKWLSPKDLADIKLWLKHRKEGSTLFSRGSGFQHAFDSLMPRKKYGKEHPEYYSLVSPEHWIGEPKPTEPTRLNDPLQPGPWQLCTSNPEVRRIIAEKLIAAKTDYIQSISPNDGYGFCECPACKKQDPAGQGITGTTYDLTDRMYNFLEDIANRVYKVSPETKIGLFSYSFYDKVPQKKIHLPGNVYLSCCYLVYRMNAQEETELNAKLTGLSKTGAKIIGREYWGTHYTMNYPLSHSRKIDRNLKLLHKIGAAGIYGETGLDFGPRASDLYILMKLSWDPTLKREDILRDFCDKAFGSKASPAMYELFEKIEDHVEKNIERMSDSRSKVSEHYNNGYAQFNHYMSTVIFNKDFFEMCDDGIRKAMKLADTKERKARVAYIANGLNYAKRTTESITSLADLASAGVDMPLTMPSGKEIVMEKSNLSKVIGRAVKAEKARLVDAVSKGGNNSFRSVILGSQSVFLRPWSSLAEMAMLKLKSDRYNYLVNGAFEYSGYSWDVSGKGKFIYTTARNHDNDYNVMVQCHHRQGISLELEVAPGGTMTVRNLRKISPAAPFDAQLKLFVRCEQDPLPLLKFNLGKTELKGVNVSKEIPEADHWYELRFYPARIPAGEQEFVITVTNPGKKPVVLTFDDLDLRLRTVNKVTK